MVKRCSWGLCNSDTRHPERLLGGVKFIRFPRWKKTTPSNREKCLRWIKACYRPHHQLNINIVERNYELYICSKHFVDGAPSARYPDPISASSLPTIEDTSANVEPKASRPSPRNRSISKPYKKRQKVLIATELENYGIPSDPSRRALGLKAINRVGTSRKPWIPSEHEVICSDHFVPEEFTTSRHGTLKILKATAVPSIFSWKAAPQGSGSSARRGGPKKLLTDMTVGVDVPELFGVKKEVFDQEDQTNHGEMVSPRELLHDVKPVFLISNAAAQESGCTHSQQYEFKHNPDAEEEFKIEVNEDWQPDIDSNGENIKTVNDGDISSISKDNRTELQIINLEDKERETTSINLSSANSLKEKLKQKLSLGRSVGCKTAKGVKGKNYFTSQANTGSQKNLTSFAGANTCGVQSSTKGGPQTLSDDAVEMVCNKGSSSETSHQAVVDNSCGSPSVVDTTVAVSEGVFMKHFSSEHKGNKVTQPSIPGVGVVCNGQISVSSDSPLSTPTGQNVLIVNNNFGEQPGGGQEVILKSAADGETSDVTQSSAYCSSQKLLLVPTAAAEISGVCSGQNALLNPGFSEEVAAGQIPAESSGQTTPDYSFFVCATCGTWIMGLQALSLHKLACSTIKNLVLTSPYVVNPGAPLLFRLGIPSHKQPITAEAMAIQGSPTVPILHPPKNLSKAMKRNFKKLKSIQTIGENIQTQENPHKWKAEADLCPKCGKSFSSPYYFDIHLRLHENEKPFTCNQCPKAFKNVGSLKRHQHRHKGEKPFQCDRCAQQFSNPNSLKRHILTHTKDGPLKCPECPATFLNLSSFRIHVRVHTGERPFSCKFCGKAFRDTSSLNVHLRIHTCNKPYKCKVCAAAFQRPSGLKQHIQVSHAAASPFVCCHCGVPFGSKGSLNKHMQFHSRAMERKNKPDCKTSELSQNALHNHS